MISQHSSARKLTRALASVCLIAAGLIACALQTAPQNAYATEITTISQTSCATENSLVILEDPASALADRGMNITQKVTCDSADVSSYDVRYYVHSGVISPGSGHRWTKSELTKYLTASISADLTKVEGTSYYSSSLVDDGESFFVGENKTWKEGETWQATFTYPLVGVYDGTQIGAYMTISGTYERAMGEVYNYANGSKVGGSFSGKTYTDFGCPMVQLPNLLYAGGYVFNSKDVTIKLQFFDAESGATISVANDATHATYLSFNSQNYAPYDAATGKIGSFGSLDSWSEDIWLPMDRTEKIETLDGGHIQIAERDGYYCALPTKGSFTDYLGGETYNYNRTTFYQNDYFEFYLPRESSYLTGWFSFDSSSIGTTRPQDPVKTADKAHPTRQDTVVWNIDQQVHTLGEDIATHYASFVFSDPLPTGLKYVSAAMYKVDGDTITDITSEAGTLSVENGTVTYTFSDAYLADMELAGETYRLAITTTITNATSNNVDVTNTATVKTNDWELDASASTRPSWIRVTKTWSDTDDAAGIRPSSVTMQISGKGTTLRSAVLVELKATNNWTKIVNLPRYNEDGTLAHYQIKELSVDGYTSTVTGGALSGFTVKNTLDLSGEATIIATKLLDGAEPGADYAFTFQLKDASSGTVLQTAKSDEKGDIVFEPIEYTFDDVGEHLYEITEVNDNQKYIVYDEHTENVKVTVSKGTGASINADVSYDDDGPLFENNYFEPVEMPVSGEGGITWLVGVAAAVLALGACIGIVCAIRGRRSKPADRPHWKPFDD